MGGLAISDHGVGRAGRTTAVTLFEVAPFLLMAPVAFGVMLFSHATDALPLLSLGPAFATMAGEFFFMLLTGGVAVVLCGVLEVYRHVLGSLTGLLDLATVIGVTIVGVIATAVVHRRKHEARQLAAIAEVTQQVLLRPVPQELGPLGLAVRYISASVGARIGGDLYETVTTSGGLRLIIGDVQGKGLPAVQTAATVLGSFRECAYEATSLAVIAERIETSLARQAMGERFVTALLAQVSGDGGTVDLLSRGHPPPLLLTEGSAGFVDMAEPALPFGLADLVGSPAAQVTVNLCRGHGMLFYTDGVSEARSGSGEFFQVSGSPALAQVSEPDAALAQLSGDLMRHVGHPLDDDAAMLLIIRRS
ncbi:MAG TPA: PP2C family protein-serine/threonine phosphatase [Streptosporangiaceae bacterium]|nr:PP2C family protein-serine/threonine phosphatase [Streptosporangiaceae bacterium]